MPVWWDLVGQRGLLIGYPLNTGGIFILFICQPARRQKIDGFKGEDDEYYFIEAVDWAMEVFPGFPGGYPGF
jgi:hypothetical protein